jgi:GH24 family phage-related lysozyme (muramidase)
MTAMRTGPRAQALMHHFEACKLTAYRCPAGVWTIGWGDTGPHVKPGLTWTRAQADAAFAERLAREFEPGVRAVIGDNPTTSAQFGAMVALAYNIGVGAFRTSTVARKHNAGDYEGAGEAFLLWNKSNGKVLKGLVRRRQAEKLLYDGDFAAFDKAVGYKG